MYQGQYQGPSVEAYREAPAHVPLAFRPFVCLLAYLLACLLVSCGLSVCLWWRCYFRTTVPVYSGPLGCFVLFCFPCNSLGWWVAGREVGLGGEVAVSQAHSKDLRQLGQESTWQVYDGRDWYYLQLANIWVDSQGGS